MKKKYYSVIWLLLFLLLNSSVYSQTDLAPLLVSPHNNAKYVQTNKLTLQWIKVPGYETYQIQISKDESFLPEFLVADIIRNGNIVTAPELEYLTDYYWKVRVDGDTPWSGIYKFTTTGFPLPVSLLLPTDGSINIEDNTIFSWSSDSLNYSYNLQFSRDAEFLDTLKNLTTNLTYYEVSGLGKGSTLYWRVKSFNRDGLPAEWSEVFSLRTKLQTPRLVYPGNFTNNLDTMVTFRWNQVALASIYKFELSIDATFEESSIIKKTESTENRITLDSLNTEELYYWRVLATNAFKDSSIWTEPFRFKTELKKPDLLSPAHGQNNMGSIVEFNWSETSDTNYYKFQISEDSTFKSVTENINVDNPSYTYSNLLNNTIYFWRVNSRNSIGDTSNWSDYGSLKTKLDVPVILFPTDGSHVLPVNIIIDWSAIDSAHFYILELWSGENFGTSLIDTVTEETTFVIDSLELNNLYSLRLKAFNTHTDSSNFSDTISFYTSGFLAQPSAIDTLINFSIDPSEIVGQITLHNPTNSQLTLKSIWAEPADTFMTDKANLILPPLSSEIIIISIDTSVVDTGWFNGSVNIITQDDESSIIPINLYSRLASASVLIDSLNFDSTANDGSALNSFYLSNKNGNYGLRIYDYKIRGNDINSFEVIDEPDRLSPQDSANIRVRFRPSREGMNDAILEMHTNNYPEPILTLPLFGAGMGNFAPVLNDTVYFDTTSSTSSSISQFFLRNFNGNLELEISGYTLIGDDTLAFEMLNEPTKISPQDSVKIRIRFTPSVLDLNNAQLQIKTNSSSDSLVNILLSGYGKGGLIAESTLTALESISDSSFETLTANNQELMLINRGDLPLQIRVSFLNNYFRLTNDEPQPFNIMPDDSLSITLQYITPNFDSLNTDSLKISHNGFGLKSLAYYLEGGFDSVATSQSIVSDLIVNGVKFSGEDYLIGEETSIRSYVDNELLDDKKNLDFRINYFLGGPGNKISAVKSSSGEFIIPFRDVGSAGLIFKGELFTRGTSYHKVDSITVFDYVDVQVVLEKYQTPDIQIINSVPAANPANADINWIFLGFPFEEIVVDSLFSFFGGSDKMEDGEWILYEYTESSNSYFSSVNTSTLAPLNAYFFAQSIIEEYSLTYQYGNAVATRKLNDNVIRLEGDGWKTISSPYTFDVEIESPAVLYKYDTNNRSYRLTSIMRPGEGYFVNPEVEDIRLKTYGEYYPQLFPKVFSGLGWHLNLNISNDKKSEELLISAGSQSILNKNSFDGYKGFEKAPELKGEFEAYISESENDRKYQAVIGSQGSGNVWDVYIKSLSDNNKIDIINSLRGELPSTIDYAIIDGGNKKAVDEFYLELNKDEIYFFKYVIGSSEFVQSKLRELEHQVPDQYSLRQNYPNPFNPATVIEYSIPKEVKGEMSKVSLKIYDVLGREVATLVNKSQSPGIYKVQFDAGNFASGVYYYRLEAGKFVESKKMLLLK